MTGEAIAFLRNRGGEKHMMGLGMPELIVILVIALLIFGAGKLPQVGSSVGKAMREFKGALDHALASSPESNTGTKPVNAGIGHGDNTPYGWRTKHA